MSELVKLNKSKTLIICFGGMALKMGGILPFEFLNFLSSTYHDLYDLIFYIDKSRSWYHEGIKGISTNIDETKKYLDNKINEGNYEKIIFMGVSAGGYAAILFGSLCNVQHVISFIPRTNLINPINKNYKNLKTVINEKTKYLLFGDLSVKDSNNNHHISQCENLGKFTNIEIVKKQHINMKILRDSGELKCILDNVLKVL